MSDILSSHLLFPCHHVHSVGIHERGDGNVCLGHFPAIVHPRANFWGLSAKRSKRGSIDAGLFFLVCRFVKCLPLSTEQHVFDIVTTHFMSGLGSGGTIYQDKRLPQKKCISKNVFHCMPLTIRAMASSSDSRGGSSPPSLQSPEIVDRRARIVSSTDSTPDSSKS